MRCATIVDAGILVHSVRVVHLPLVYCSLLRRVRRLTGGRVPIVGVGGVASGADAFELIASGARLVQLYSALAFDGPLVVCRIRDELDHILRYCRRL